MNFRRTLSLLNVSSRLLRFHRGECLKCPCDTSEPFAPNVAMNILDNGVRVASEKLNTPLVTISMFIAAGPKYETRCDNGITHFIEHLALKGFMSMSKQRLEKYFYENGLVIKSKTTQEYLWFATTCMPQHIVTILDIYTKICYDLEFSEIEMEIAKQSICQELVGADNDARRLTFEYLIMSAYQGTPLGQGIMGSPDRIRNFTRDQLRKYVLTNFVPTRVVIAASGAIKHGKLVSCCQGSLGTLPPPPLCQEDPIPKRYTGSQVLYRDDSMPYAHIAIALEAPGYFSADYLPLLIGKHIIGSWGKSQGGFPWAWGSKMSGVAEAASQSNLCERFDAFYIAFAETGLWGVYFVSDKHLTDNMILYIQNYFMNMSCTLSASDVSRAAQQMSLILPKSVEKTFDSCLDLGRQVLLTCKRTEMADVAKKARDQQMLKVQEVLGNYIYDKCPVVTGVGPVEGVLEYSRIRSYMYWLRI